MKTAGNTEDGTAAGCGLARIDVGAPAASSGDSPSGHHDSTHAIQGPRCGLPVARKITSQSLPHVRDIAAGRIVACRLSGEGGGLCDLMRAAPRTVRARSCSLTTEPVNASDSASLGRWAPPLALQVANLVRMRYRGTSTGPEVRQCNIYSRRPAQCRHAEPQSARDDLLILRIVLIVSIGIVAGYCVECLAVQGDCRHVRAPRPLSDAEHNSPESISPILGLSPQVLPAHTGLPLHPRT